MTSDKYTGVKYVNAVRNTEYKCIISLNLTVTADKIIPTPNENNTNNISGIGDSITVQCNSERIAIITRSNAVNEAIRLIKL